MTDEDTDELQGELTTLLSSSNIVFGGDLLSKAIRFGAFVLVTRALSVPNFGSLSLVLVVFQIMSTLSLFGQNNALQYFLPGKDNLDKQYDIARKSQLVVLVVSLLAMGLVAASAGQIARLFETPELVPPLYVVAVTLPFATQFKVNLAITQAFEMTKPRVYIENILHPVLRFCFIAIVAALGLGAAGILSAYLTAYAIVAIASLSVVVRRFSTARGNSSGVPTLELVSFSAPLLAVGLINMVTGQVDKFLLGILMTNYEVGVFNVVFTLGQHLLITLASVRYIFMPVFSRLADDTDERGLSDFYRRVTRLVFYSTMGVAAFVVVFAEPMLTFLFRPAYAAAADSFRMLVFGYVVVAFFGLNDDALVSLGFSRIHVFGAILTVITNAGLDLLLIPEYGVLGAVIGTAVALFISELFFSAILYRKVGIHVLTWAMVVPAFVGLSIPIAAGSLNLLNAGLVAKMSVFITWIVAFTAAILISNGVEERDRRIIRSSLTQTWNRII